MSPAKKSRTDRAAQGSAPTWIGTCSAWAMRRPSRSQMPVEKSRLELRICEYEVRSIASPISSTMARRRCWTTETVIGSTGAVMSGGPGRQILHRRGDAALAVRDAGELQRHLDGGEG